MRTVNSIKPKVFDIRQLSHKHLMEKLITNSSCISEDGRGLNSMKRLIPESQTFQADVKGIGICYVKVTSFFSNVDFSKKDQDTGKPGLVFGKDNGGSFFEEFLYEEFANRIKNLTQFSHIAIQKVRSQVSKMGGLSSLGSFRASRGVPAESERRITTYSSTRSRTGPKKSRHVNSPLQSDNCTLPRSSITASNTSELFHKAALDTRPRSSVALSFGQLSESSEPDTTTEIIFKTALTSDALQINSASENQPPSMHTPNFEFMQRRLEDSNLLQVEP